MAITKVPLILLKLLILVFGYAAIVSSVAYEGIPSQYDAVFLNRSSFPAGFIFGSASSSYQYEGAAKEGGRGPSLWDYYTHQHPERIEDRSNGDVATDEYHRYKEDVGIMKEMNLDGYRFSISWSRLLPKGTLDGGVNKEGIQYYNNLINELLAKGDHFKDFAELCFKEFGDRVKHWFTLNEPYYYAVYGYANGNYAPARCSSWQNLNCTGGDSGTEPYLVYHNLILSHAAAVKVYKEKYQASQKGKIGIALASHWYVSYSDAKHNLNAALRSLDFTFGWFMDPLTFGDYPHAMRVLVGKRLPKFTREESKLVKGSFDFIGINYYTTNYAAYAPNHNTLEVSILTDPRTNITAERNGVPIGPQATGSRWIHVYPAGLYNLLVYTMTKYNNPLIYIAENGISEKNDPTLSFKQALNDTQRIDYHFRHLSYLHKAIKKGVNVKAYFAWSLLDDFEFTAGYTVRFGIYYVDFNNGQKRYPKLSAHWFKKILEK